MGKDSMTLFFGSPSLILYCVIFTTYYYYYYYDLFKISLSRCPPHAFFGSIPFLSTFIVKSCDHNPINIYVLTS